MESTLNKIESFVQATRDVVYLRDLDKIMIIRPNKIQHLNNSAFEMLDSLYHKHKSARETISILSDKYTVSESDLLNDLTRLLDSINAIMNEEYSRASMVETIEYDPGSIKYPVISEIALTYRCQNKCDFCYASSPYRGKAENEMSTDEVKKIIDKIKNEAHVPTLSFTGGEPTLRRDLPELIKYADSTGMRTNLITNGVLCSDKEFVDSLASAGLKSAQVSLESHSEEIHNSITNNSKAYKNTVQGIKNLKSSGIYTHTNTTICQKNKKHLKALVKFIQDEFDFPYLSMNMIITTGIARDNDNINIGYSTIGDIIKPVIDYCETLGIKFVWYSPTPYCLFNPVDHNLGSKSCACISGLVSVNPSGEVLPCSSYDRGVGNLLKHSFDYIWNSDQACYWRDKRYLPPVCKKCSYDELCAGACPLYWENACSFHEIEKVNNRKPRIKNFFWNVENKLRIKTRGVDGIKSVRR